MEPLFQYVKQIHSPLYDRRLMILILKKTNGRRSFSETCRSHNRDRHNEPNTQTQTQKQKHNQKEGQGDFRCKDGDLSPQQIDITWG